MGYTITSADFLVVIWNSNALGKVQIKKS
jgi:hypothetical protein